MDSRFKEVLGHSDETMVSLYKNLTDKENVLIPIRQVLESVKTGSDFKHIIDEIRATKDKTRRDNLKKRLPAVTFSAVYDGQRLKENLLHASGFACIDFDNVKDIQNAKQTIASDPFCYSVLVSPSGTGLKAIIKIEYGKHLHVELMESLFYYFEKKYSLVADRSGKDISRLMFLSYDDNIYINDSSANWNILEYSLFRFNAIKSYSIDEPRHCYLVCAL